MISADLKRKAKRIPDTPGVYFFIGARRKVLYIGKAASLRDRVRSYFSRSLMETRSPAISGMVGKAVSVKWQKTVSVLEALILEANLIKKYQPPFNVEQKDNKSWNHVVITKEPFPRVLLVRGRQLHLTFLKAQSYKLAATYGPFPHSKQLQEALRIIRKIFPFRDTCMPESGKPCFNRQIGLCPGVCSGETGKEEYTKTIQNIRDIFSGNFKSLKRRLVREMKHAVKAETYELAEALRRQIYALEHVRDVSLIKEERRTAFGGAVHSGVFRIEAYDVAHTSGQEAVGVMVVVEDGEPAKSEYRMFKIRDSSNNDTKALQEILRRRLAHPEWRLPRLIVVDGGKAQMNAALRILGRAGVGISVAAVVKDEFHRPRDVIGSAVKTRENEVLLANSEAHRFALRFHRRRRGRLDK